MIDNNRSQLNRQSFISSVGVFKQCFQSFSSASKDDFILKLETNIFIKAKGDNCRWETTK